ncbi:MAG: hypothetical protein ACM31C_23615 [Acidobacteriota bacterium]
MLAACAAAGVGCSGGESTQVVTGKVTARGAIAVRAVDGSDIITESRVRSDGSFTLSLPAGQHYRLQVLTWGGVQPIMGKTGALAFDVCQPSDPWDMGGVGSGSGSGGTGGGAGSGGYCVPPPPIDANGNPCDPMSDPTCLPPPPCDPMTDPSCACLPPPPPPGCDLGTGSGSNCPPPCDPATDPMCFPPPPPPPPGCDPGTGSGSGSGSGYGSGDGSSCPPPPPPPCDPMTDPTCPYPPPPCTDPTDPTTCQDPCMADPTQCGMGSGSGCWPPPCDPADPSCAMGSGMWPQHPPGDFGCGGGSAQ